jgi:hypothetical protein
MYVRSHALMNSVKRHLKNLSIGQKVVLLRSIGLKRETDFLLPLRTRTIGKEQSSARSNKIVQNDSTYSMHGMACTTQTQRSEPLTNKNTYIPL